MKDGEFLPVRIPDRQDWGIDPLDGSWRRAMDRKGLNR